MKIALCLHGKVGEEHWRVNTRYYAIEAVNEIKNNILKKYPTTDIFIHCWDDNKNSQIINNLYKPKKFRTEKQKRFADISKKYSNYEKKGMDTENVISNWYSIYQSDLLRREFEDENNIKYDLVVHSRFDIKFINFKGFEKYLNDKLNVLDCRQINGKVNQTYSKYYIDYIFFGTSEIMKRFTNLFIDIDEFIQILIDTGLPLSTGTNHYLSGLYPLHKKIPVNMVEMRDILIKLYRAT